jgi:hypothetical protein
MNFPQDCPLVGFFRGRFVPPFLPWRDSEDAIATQGI